MSRKTRSPLSNLESLIQDGENPNGFTAETCNGTAHWRGTGWNLWPNTAEPQVEPRPAWPAGRSNRTGE